MRFWILLFGIGCAVPGFAEELTINAGQRLLERDIESSAAPIGSGVAELAFKDIQGRTHRISDSSATAVVFLSTSCPLAKRYTQRLNQMHDDFAADGMLVCGVFSNSEDNAAQVAEHAEKMQFAFPVVKDVHGYLAKRLGARMTPQAVVVEANGTIRYRGAIDDNRYENRVKKSYLRDALVAIREGQPIAQPETKSLGCSIHLSTAAELGEVTYTEQIARILQDNCQSCHRPQQVAPFALTNYREAKTWATEIQHYTKARLMPPWKAAAGFGEFQHEQRLTAEQIALIERWVESGAPEGPAAALPPAANFSDGWTLGQPDYVLEMPDDYVIGPEGEDDYRHFVIPTNFDQDMYVVAADVIPGNRQTVHHVIVYTDTSGKARELDAADPGLGYTWFGGVGFKAASSIGGWAPGSRPVVAPEGTGRWLPKGADVVLQVHYYRTGVEETDRTKVGLYFSRHPAPVRVHSGVAINNKFTIPARETRYKVEASWEVKESAYAISVFPHMHLLGKEMKVTATLPDGTLEPLVWIKDWDFAWQGAFHFRDPLWFPKGTKVQVVSYFDNSSENPHNPHDPPQPVGWGEKTTDEMCIAFVGFVKASEWQPKSVGAKAAKEENAEARLRDESGRTR